MKLEEFEAFRIEEERLLTPELGPEKARDQLRSDIAQARNKRAGMPKRYRRDSASGEDGLSGVCSSPSLRYSNFIYLIFSHNVN
jgi:hypothetical protein